MIGIDSTAEQSETKESLNKRRLTKATEEKDKKDDDTT